VSCLFCEIASGRTPAAVVFEDEHCLAFLDYKPLFHGHVLLVPRLHVETLTDLPAELIGAIFTNAKTLARAVERAMEAEGTFVAINNRVSQSVPHLHIHVVPRSKGDGLRGFFWPRTKYASGQRMSEVRDSIRTALEEHAYNGLATAL